MAKIDNMRVVLATLTVRVSSRHSGKEGQSRVLGSEGAAWVV